MFTQPRSADSVRSLWKDFEESRTAQAAHEIAQDHDCRRLLVLRPVPSKIQNEGRMHLAHSAASYLEDHVSFDRDDIRRDFELMSMFRSTASRANSVQVLSIAESGNLNAISRYEREGQKMSQKHSDFLFSFF